MAASIMQTLRQSKSAFGNNHLGTGFPDSDPEL